MSLLDRIMGKPVHYSLNVVSEPEYKFHNFCGKCGQPMVDGYLIVGDAFDRETGDPVHTVVKRRMCVSIHGKQRSTQVDKSGHDGAIQDSEWHWEPTSEVPRRCPAPASKPKKAKRR